MDDFMGFMSANWAEIAPLIVLALGALGSVGGFLLWAARRIVEKRVKSVDDQATEALARARVALNETTAARIATDAMSKQFETLARALEYANHRIVQQETIVKLLSSNHLKLKKDHERLSMEHEELKAKHDEVWAYAMAWEAAVEPEEADVQTRIRGRVGKHRPSQHGRG